MGRVSVREDEYRKLLENLEHYRIALEGIASYCDEWIDGGDTEGHLFDIRHLCQTALRQHLIDKVNGELQHHQAMVLRLKMELETMTPREKQEDDQ